MQYTAGETLQVGVPVTVDENNQVIPVDTHNWGPPMRGTVEYFHGDDDDES